MDYSIVPMPDILIVINERIEELKKRKHDLNWSTIGPLHPRSMLWLLDRLLEKYPVDSSNHTNAQ